MPLCFFLRGPLLWGPDLKGFGHAHQNGFFAQAGNVSLVGREQYFPGFHFAFSCPGIEFAQSVSVRFIESVQVAQFGLVFGPLFLGKDNQVMIHHTHHQLRAKLLQCIAKLRGHIEATLVVQADIVGT